MEVLRAVHRVLRGDGIMWLNLGDCYATGAGKVGEAPGGGERGARWRGEMTRHRDAKRRDPGRPFVNGRGEPQSVPAKNTVGPMTQPNRMPIPGLKPKDLVGIPWRVAFAAQADGWWLRSDVVWAKAVSFRPTYSGSVMPESVTDRPTRSHEYLFMLTKAERYFSDFDAIREVAATAEEIVDDDGADGHHGGASHAGQGTSTRKFRAGRSGNKAPKYDVPTRPNDHLARSVPWEGMTRNVRSVWARPAVRRHRPQPRVRGDEPTADHGRRAAVPGAAGGVVMDQARPWTEGDERESIARGLAEQRAGQGEVTVHAFLREALTTLDAAREQVRLVEAERDRLRDSERAALETQAMLKRQELRNEKLGETNAKLNKRANEADSLRATVARLEGALRRVQRALSGIRRVAHEEAVVLALIRDDVDANLATASPELPSAILTSDVRTARQCHIRRAQPVESREVSAWIAERHYLRSCPPGFIHAYEFVEGRHRIGAALLGRPSARQYDADRIAEVTRFYFVDDTPTHVESHGLALLRKQVRVWLPQLRLLLAYSDPEQGHDGTIYEADGWAPFGLTDGAWGDGWQSRLGRRDRRVSKKQRWVRTP